MLMLTTGKTVAVGVIKAVDENKKVPLNAISTHRQETKEHSDKAETTLESLGGVPGPFPLALHERLPEILVVPREKNPKGAAARRNP